MRPTFIAIAFGLVSMMGATAFAATDAARSAAVASNAASSGPAWCGFQDKAGSRVRCGYSNESNCKQAVGAHDAVCIVDPYLTERRRARADG